MKIKFISILTAALFIAGVNAKAQSGTQIKAGINLANVSVTDDGRVNDANSLTSFHVGLVKDFRLASMISLQSGILYTGKGSKIQHGNSADAGYYKQTSNPFYLEVPVNLILKAPIGTGSSFFVGAGPYLAVGVAGKNTTEGRTLVGTTYNRERDIKFSDDDPSTLSEEEGTGFGVLRRFDYGLNGTAGIEGKSIVLNVNYGYGLAKLQSGTNNNQDNNNKHRVLSFGIGFKL